MTDPKEVEATHRNTIPDWVYTPIPGIDGPGARIIIDLDADDMVQMFTSNGDVDQTYALLVQAVEVVRQTMDGLIGFEERDD